MSYPNNGEHGKTKMSQEQELGQWEEHTKGFGSKMLKKMGFKVGQGLGKNNEGITEPIKIRANKGRTTLGTHNVPKSKSKKDKKLNFGDSSDEDEVEDENSDHTDDNDRVQFDEDHQEVEEDSLAHISKLLLASNERLIKDRKLNLSEEISNKEVLEQTRRCSEMNIKDDRDTVKNYRRALSAIDDLDTINRNDRLDLDGFWTTLDEIGILLEPKVSNKVRGHLLQVFSIPLLEREFELLRIQSQPGLVDSLSLEKSLFPDIIKVTIEWLKTKDCYGHLIEWYQEWMLKFKDIMHLPRIKHFRRRMLDVMYLATLEHHRDLNSYRYIDYDQWKPQRAEDNHVRYDPIEASKLSLRALVEETAIERGLLFRPIENRRHDGKQVYEFGQETIYIDNMIIFLRRRSKWLPMNLDDLLGLVI